MRLVLLEGQWSATNVLLALLWTSLGWSRSSHILPIAAIQLAPLIWSHLEADLSAHTVIVWLGRLVLLRQSMRKPTDQTTDQQPDQDSRLHRAPSFSPIDR